MKTIKFLAIAILALVSTSVYAQKFAVINTGEIIQKMAEKDSVSTKLEEHNKKIQSEYQAMVDEFNKKAQEYQSQASTLSKAMAQQKEKELQNMQQNIQGFEQVAQQEINTKQQELLKPIYDKMNEEIAKAAKAGAYTFVFDKTVPLYVNEAAVTDITATVSKAFGF